MIELITQDLVREEGFSPHAYRDTRGFLTIGYGRLIDKRRGKGLSQYEAREMLVNDVNRLIGSLDHNIPWWATQPENVQRALANMAYQLGTTGLLGFKKMLEALKQGDYNKAYIEALDSDWAQQTPQRARRIAELLRGENHE